MKNLQRKITFTTSRKMASKFFKSQLQETGRDIVDFFLEVIQKNTSDDVINHTMNLLDQDYMNRFSKFNLGDHINYNGTGCIITDIDPMSLNAPITLETQDGSIFVIHPDELQGSDDPVTSGIVYTTENNIVENNTIDFSKVNTGDKVVVKGKELIVTSISLRDEMLYATENLNKTANTYSFIEIEKHIPNENALPDEEELDDLNHPS